MQNIELKEAKLNKLKRSKYKSAYNKNLLLKSLKTGVFFAILMIIIRCLALWLLSFKSEIPYKELITSKYYYGNGSGKVYDYVEFLIGNLWNVLYSESFDIVLDIGGLGLLDWILVIICYIYKFILSILLLETLIIYPIIYFIIKVICAIDSIIPLEMGVVYGWFLYLTLFTTLIIFISQRSKTKNKLKDLIDLGELLKNVTLRKMLKRLVVLTIMISLVAPIFIDSTKTSESKDIRKLIIVNNEESKYYEDFEYEEKLWKLIESYFQ